MNNGCWSISVDFYREFYEFKRISEGGEYFLLIFKPHEPNSFVVLAENPCVGLVELHTSGTPGPPMESFSMLFLATDLKCPY